MILYDIGAAIVVACIFLSGIYMRYWVGKRRFSRRGVGGLQQFSSYSMALMTSTYERLVLWLSIPLLIIGILGGVIWVVHFRESIKNGLIKRTEKEDGIKEQPISSSIGTGYSSN